MRRLRTHYGLWRKRIRAIGRNATRRAECRTPTKAARKLRQGNPPDLPAISKSKRGEREVKAGFGRRLAQAKPARVANQALALSRSKAFCRRAGNKRGLAWRRPTVPALAPKTAVFPQASNCKEWPRPISWIECRVFAERPLNQSWLPFVNPWRPWPSLWPRRPESSSCICPGPSRTSACTSGSRT